ncbi:MAG: ABC transporter ATP-binding protein [Candidatus Omnitrophota bacterium]|jgi:ABC-type dipeptide/oligopeptide/nickel transport system ATPase component
MRNLLEIKGLKVNFYLGRQVISAVDGVNLDIACDEVLVLAGESGSGKSVTALAITNILPRSARITGGEVIFEGNDLTGALEPDLIKVRGKEIAYIFQEPSAYLNPVYTIGAQICEAIMLHQNKTAKEAEEEAGALLEQVKIKDPGKTLLDYPHQLSGGMNQRVFIAMALACRPKLLIADEPTTSLDVTIEAEILGLLMDLKKKIGFSLLFITHNLSIAKRIADRICVMYQGKVVEEGARDNIFASPQHPHTRELISAYEKIGKI